MIKSIYLIGSLRNPKVPTIAHALRIRGFEVFDEWFSAGPEADDYLQKYSNHRGMTYEQALQGYAAQHVFQFDLTHLKRCDAAVMVLPAGRSGHLELGFVRGMGKPGFILLAGKVDRYDVMYNFASAVCENLSQLHVALKGNRI